MWTLILVFLAGSSLQGTTAIILPSPYQSKTACEAAYAQMSTNNGSNNIKSTLYYCVPTANGLK